MHRKEIVLAIDLNKSLATFIKHEFGNKIRWPSLSIGVVLSNTTTSINEEWLTSVEAMPTKKVFYEYTKDIITNKVNFCVHIKYVQQSKINIVTMYDFDYYIIKDNKITKINKPSELKNTLLHSFQDFRQNNLQTIELIAFSSSTVISENLVNGLTFVDVEQFNKEYDNIKPSLPLERVWHLPFIVIAPNGKLKFYVETYSWIDTAKFFKEIIDILEDELIQSVRLHKLKTHSTDDQEVVKGVSMYNVTSGMLYVSDLVTMCVVNFFGGDVRLHSYHKIDIGALNIDAFIDEITKAFERIRALV
ncbi:RNA polymerase [Pteropox virus]|uniref:DNA-directed RNA polymerase 35 kDa subunit n=1 Tax=Pteropox virus TaxID=1873698 RepID=A0A1B1MRJ3_9POXV|nr:RNA polymerase [Pteropox virus]ANS71208.1 RNA polymerase [Pteropox virus]